MVERKSIATARVLVSLAMWIVAAWALNTGSVSPAGEHVAKLPPMVPALRI